MSRRGVGGACPSAPTAPTEGAELALVQVLAHHPHAAFLVDESGRARPMNTGADLALASSHRAILERITQALRDGASDAFDVVPIRSPGAPARFVVVASRCSAHGLGARADLAAARWGLTPRQRDVLVALAAGLSNKEIAGRLDCAEVTIERHLSALYRAARAPGRTRLLAALAAL